MGKQNKEQTTISRQFRVFFRSLQQELGRGKTKYKILLLNNKTVLYFFNKITGDVNSVRLTIFAAPRSPESKCPFIVTIDVNDSSLYNTDELVKKTRSNSFKKFEHQHDVFNVQIQAVPSQLLHLIPWITGVIKANESGDSSFIVKPTAPLFVTTEIGPNKKNVVWTITAGLAWKNYKENQK